MFENVPIARDGIYEYYGQEMGPKYVPNRLYKVYRAQEEYNKEPCKSSLLSIPITDDHPDYNVNSDTCSMLEKGHTEGTAFFEDDLLKVPKVLVKDSKLQDKVARGIRELSIGFFGSYDFEFNSDDIPDHIDPSCIDAIEHIDSINHLAIVPEGKAGFEVRLNKKIDVMSKNVTENKIDMETSQILEGISSLKGFFESALSEMKADNQSIKEKMSVIEKSFKQDPVPENGTERVSQEINNSMENNESDILDRLLKAIQGMVGNSEVPASKDTGTVNNSIKEVGSDKYDELLDKYEKLSEIVHAKEDPLLRVSNSSAPAPTKVVNENQRMKSSIDSIGPSFNVPDGVIPEDKIEELRINNSAQVNEYTAGAFLLGDFINRGFGSVAHNFKLSQHKDTV